jgi:hypothetical protein
MPTPPEIERRFKMDREILLNKSAICDICGRPGAFDYMGDCVCPECIEKAERLQKTQAMQEQNLRDAIGGELFEWLEEKTMTPTRIYDLCHVAWERGFVAAPVKVE